MPTNRDFLHIFDERGHVRPLDALIDEAITVALAARNGNVSEVAQQMRIGRSTLYRMFAANPGMRSPAPPDDDSPA